MDKAMVTRMVSLLLSEDPGQILVLDSETGTAPLHQACYVGHTSCVKLMVNKVCVRYLVIIVITFTPHLPSFPPHTHTYRHSSSPSPPPFPLSLSLQVCAGGLVPAGATGSLPPGALSSPHILKHPPTLRKIAQVVDVVAKDGSSPLIIAAMGGHIEVC